MVKKHKRRSPGMSVQIGKIGMENPVMVASGTYEYNEVTKELIDIKQFGAIVTKTITLRPREGNPLPRTCETYAGLLNAIGLQNKGLNAFLIESIPSLKKLRIPIIVSISGDTAGEFKELAGNLAEREEVAGIELNLSCPNLTNKRLFAQNADATYDVVCQVREMTDKTIIAKLTPNVTNISEIARSAERAGADAISLVNTFFGMAIDIKKKEPKLGNVTGGLSGPAIKPIALRMVWDVSKKVKIPIIGMGGIMSGEDAIEFIIAGASAVAVGTGSFINPNLGIEIIRDIKKYLSKNNINGMKQLTGSLAERS